LRLLAPDHDPRASVVLLAGEAGESKTEPGASGSASIETYAPNEVAVHASAPAGGWLVLADAWHPGWRATVDGVERPVLRADGALRAVRLAPGEHAVVFRFWPPGLSLGLVLGALGALATAAVAIVRRIKA
jgi:uncharacterized membrane protein YfhO